MEAHHWTFEQARRVTLCQLAALGIGSEELAKQAKAEAIRRSPERIRRRAEGLMEYYRKHGIDAR